MTIQLYDYQTEMVDKIYAAIRAGQTQILAIAVMGAGKTILSSWIMRDCVNRGGRVLFLVLYNVLIDQTLETLQMLGVRGTALQGKRKLDPAAPVVVASIQTIRSRIAQGQTIPDLLGQPRLIFADEAHLCAFDATYDLITASFPKAITIGLTATPWRLSKKEWLGQKYHHVVVGPQPPDIIKRGKAVPARGFTIGDVFDSDQLRVSQGDYSESDMVKQASQPDCLAFVADEWQRLCGASKTSPAESRPTLMVGAGIKQIEHQAQEFNRRGIKAELITGKTPHIERKAIFRRVADGETKIICSVGCLTAGFNLPALSATLYVRKTKSKALFHQTAGRASRTAPGKTNYYLLDFGGNLEIHGDPMGPQDYNIQGECTGQSKTMIKPCPQCTQTLNIFVAECPFCGYKFSEEDDSHSDDEQMQLIQLAEYMNGYTSDKLQNIRQWRRQAWKNNVSPDEPITHFIDTYGHQQQFQIQIES